jgi:RNA polymerase sigma factor (sigma-70 family)
VLSHLRKLVGAQAPPEQPDAELLGRFVRQQDETAFAALVERHARLVWSVCRNLLSREQDAEDAFQATLLVLARKAGSIRQDRSVASWLHGVARRTALKARTTIARRQKYEQRARTGSVPDPVSEAAMRELQAILDEEVRRLPEKYRAPFILCCLESKSKAEAAHDLGWPEGTVSSRVAAARQRLQQRLARRGIELSAALTAVALAGAAARAAPVTAGVVRAAVAFAARGTLTAGGVTARAIAIAQAVLWTEAASRLKLFLVLILVLTLTGGAAAWWQHRPAQPRGDDPGRPPADVAVEGPRRGPEDKPADAGEPGPAAGPPRVFAGRVLDARGQPRPGARVSLLGEPNVISSRFGHVDGSRKVLGKARADEEGHFTLAVSAADAEAHWNFSLVAAGDGDGLNWMIPGDAARQNIVLRLPPAHTVRGRLVDAQDHPAAAVAVRLAALVRRGTRGVQLLGPGEPGAGLVAPVMSDAQGGFEVQGAPPDCEVQLLVQDDRFAPQWLVLTTTTGDHTDAGTLRLAPRRTLEGTVVNRDTGRPLAGVYVAATSVARQHTAAPSFVDTHTDTEGKFRLAPFPGQAVTLLLYPPAGLPYLAGNDYLDWPDDNPRRVRMTLQAGVLLQGRVTEKGSGKPVAGANLHFLPRTNPHPILSRRRVGETAIAWHLGATASGPDGRFVLVGLPGPGHLIVKTNQLDFIHVETTTELLTEGKDGGSPCCPDALLPLDLEEGSGPKTLAVELRRGVTVKGTIVGPDGRPATAVIVSPTYFPREGYQYRVEELYAPGGRFELPGLDPERAVPVLFSDYTGRLGARAEMKGSGEATVRLAPCRSAVVRFMDADGKPAVGVKVLRKQTPKVSEVVVVFGGLDGKPAVEVKVSLDVLVHSHPAVVNQWNMVMPGWTTPSATLAGPRFAEAGKRPGEVIFRGLIPGATYLIQADEGLGMVVKGKFTVAADEDPKVPDVVVRRQEKPPQQRR